MKYTEDQRKVINIRGKNVLTSAAAGSGKTAVLVERVIRRVIDDGIDIDRLLVVTFTNAAAAEMKERIRSAIESAAELDPENRRLEEQISLISSAPITTIDSFCLDLIRNNFNAAGIDPAFRVADEGELKMLKADSMSGLMDRQYEDADSNAEFLKFIDDFSVKRSDEDVTDTIEKLYEYAMSRPDPEGYVKSIAKQYRCTSVEELNEKEFVKTAYEMSADAFMTAKERLSEAAEIAAGCDGPYMYADEIAENISMIERLLEAKDYTEVYERIETASFGRLSSKKDQAVDQDKRDQAKALREAAKRRVADTVKKFFFTGPEKILQILNRSLPAVEELSRLTLEYMHDFGESKRKRQVVDFNDIEHMALMILKDDETKKRYREHFEEIIIDEYQDSNRVQEEIFRAVAGNNNYFCVGDVKQSIYSFRDACPELFINKYMQYREGKAENSELITLSKNFRSRQEVIDAVNLVFSSIMTPENGGIAYDADAALYYGDVYHNRTDDMQTEFACIEEDPSGEEDRKVTEAFFVARRIKELTGHTDIEDRKSGEVHKCRYGDIVILMRALRGWEDTFVKVLTDSGIPVHTESKTGYLVSEEIMGIMNLLNIIDNPLQDIPFTGVMTGIFGGFTNDETALIRAAMPDGYMSEAVKKAALQDDDTGRKCEGFLQMLAKYRKQVPYTPIHELIACIIKDSGYDFYVRSMPDGEKRLANLNMLCYRAAEFEKTSYRGLFRFIRYIENMKKYDYDFGEAPEESKEDAVHIMSIHHSKGLEFPVVFLSGMQKMFNRADMRARLIADDELGAGIDYVDSENRIRYRSLIKNVVAARQKKASLGEEMRILYVAMTRAEEKLIMTGTVERPPEDAKVRIKDTDEAGSFYDLIDGALSYDDRHIVCRSFIPYKNAVEDAVNEAVVKKDARDIYLNISEDVTYDAETSHMLEKSNSFIYPYKSSRDVPKKLSVSFLKHQAMEEAGRQFDGVMPEEKKCIPRFISGLQVQPGGPVIGALRGTAYHTAFQNIDIRSIGSTSDVRVFKEKLVKENRLSMQAAEMIDEYDILKFVGTSLAERMAEADEQGKLYREQPFVIGRKASEADETYPDDEIIMIQGIIDVFFEENGELVIADYKTDRVDQADELVLRYRAQLDYYAKALEQITGKKVSGKIIYSVTLGQEILLQ